MEESFWQWNNKGNRVITRYVNRATFVEKLTEVQQTVEQLLAQLQASEHDKFAAHLYRSRKEPVSLRTRWKGREANRALRHFDVSSRREHGVQGRISPTGAPAAGW
jgi:hypothetical protein